MDRRFYRFGALLCLLATAGIENAAASCGTASCPLDLNRIFAKKFQVQLGFENIEQDQLRRGRHTVAFGQYNRLDHDELETLNRNMQLHLNYQHTPRFSLSLSWPLVHRQHRHIAGPGHDHQHDDDHAHGKLAAANEHLETWRFTRFADPVVSAHYRLHPEFALSFGLSAPLGSTRVRNDAGALAEPSLQPGTGAWGYILEAAFARDWPQKERTARLFSSTSLRLNDSGKRGYRFGNQLLAHAGGHYPIWGAFDLLGQLAARWNGRDGAGSTGESVDSTGGTRLYLSPGLRYNAGAEIALYGYYQIPLYEHLNGLQLTAARNLLAGIDYHFDLF